MNRRRVEPLHSVTSSELVDTTVLRTESPDERAVIRLLAFAEQHAVEPSLLLDALAPDCKAQNRRSVIEIARDLESGTAVADALERHPNLISPEIALAVRMAIDSSSRNALYQEILAADQLAGDNWTRKGLRSGLIGSLNQIAFSVFLITGLMIFVIPTFVEMFEEFELKLPAPTLLFIEVSRAFARYGGIVLMLGMVVLTAFGMSRFGRWKTILTRRGFNILAWRKAWVSEWTRLLSLLAIGTQSQGIDNSIQILSEFHPSVSLRKRALVTTHRVKQGENIFRAMNQTGLLTRNEALALSTTKSADAQAWILRWSAAERQSRQLSRTGFLCRILSVASLCCLAFITAFAAISVFLPLISMVQALAS